MGGRSEGTTGLFEYLTHSVGVAASLIAALVSLAGISAILIVGARAHRLSAYLSAFATGFLSVTVLFHLFPEAIDDSPDAWIWTFVAFAVMAALGILIQIFFQRRSEYPSLAFGYVSIIALSFHSLVDGGVYAASFHDEVLTGILAVTGLILHEFPEGIIAYLFLRAAGHNSLQSAVGAFLAAGVSTIFGAVVGTVLISDVLDEPPIGALYGASSGALAYVLLVHLIPHAIRTPRRRGYLAASIGVVIATLAVIAETLNHAH